MGTNSSAHRHQASTHAPPAHLRGGESTVLLTHHLYYVELWQQAAVRQSELIAFPNLPLRIPSPLAPVSSTSSGRRGVMQLSKTFRAFQSPSSGLSLSAGFELLMYAGNLANMSRPVVSDSRFTAASLGHPGWGAHHCLKKFLSLVGVCMHLCVIQQKWGLPSPTQLSSLSSPLGVNGGDAGVTPLSQSTMSLGEGAVPSLAPSLPAFMSKSACGCSSAMAAMGLLFNLH